MGTDGIHLRVLRELVETLTKRLSIIYQQPWLTREVPADRRLANVAQLQERPENGSGEPQPCQPDLGSGESQGAHHFEPHHMSQAIQPRNHVQPADL